MKIKVFDVQTGKHSEYPKAKHDVFKKKYPKSPYSQRYFEDDGKGSTSMFHIGRGKGDLVKLHMSTITEIITKHGDEHKKFLTPAPEVQQMAEKLVEEGKAKVETKKASKEKTE